MTAQLINNPFSFSPGDPSATVLFTNRMRITQIEFAGYDTATDSVEVQNSLGQIVWTSTGNADLSTVRSGCIGWIYGLLVPANTSKAVVNIPSGQLLVYFG